jgi:hypothetical protein
MSWLIRVHAGGRLVGGTGDDTCRVDDIRHDGAASVVPARVPAQDIPLGALPLPNAGRLRLHLRHHLWWGIALNFMAYFVAAHVSYPGSTLCV